MGKYNKIGISVSKYREMEILLKKKPNNEGAPIGSYAIPEA